MSKCGGDMNGAAGVLTGVGLVQRVRLRLGQTQHELTRVRARDRVHQLLLQRRVGVGDRWEEGPLLILGPDPLRLLVIRRLRLWFSEEERIGCKVLLTSASPGSAEQNVGRGLTCAHPGLLPLPTRSWPACSRCSASPPTAAPANHPAPGSELARCASRGGDARPSTGCR